MSIDDSAMKETRSENEQQKVADETVRSKAFAETGDIEPSFIGGDQDRNIVEIPGTERKAHAPPELETEEPLDAFYGTIQEVTVGTRLMQMPKLMHEVQETIIGTDDRVRIPDTKQKPFRWICSLLITTKDNKRFVGTGFYIGNRTIATAGHCLYMRDHGGWAKSIEVAPARNSSDLPYGSFVSTKFRSVEGWTRDTKRIFDYGVIIAPQDHTFGAQNGYFGFANLTTGQLRGKMMNNVGYPSDGGQAKIRGTQWAHSRKIVDMTDTTISYDNDTIGGNSGCPCYIIQDGRVIVVCIHTTGGIVSNSGTRIRSDVYQNLKKWKAEGDL